MVTPQVAVGVGVGYASLDLTDVANDFVNLGSYNNYNYYNPGYTNTYGNGRAMTYKKLTIEGNAKFFFIEDSMIKPYIGGAISFNRSTHKYENTNSYTTGGVNFGNEDYGSSAVGGAAKLGAEISFSDTIGANLEFAYAKNITSGISKSSQVSAATNPDQGRLENVSREIEEGSTTSIQAGLVIKF